MEDMTKGRAKFLAGMELLAQGASTEDVVKALGLRDAGAWYSMRSYHGNKRLAERAKAEAEAGDGEKPEPAAILADIDCERSAPRAAAQRAETPPLRAALDEELARMSSSHTQGSGLSGTASVPGLETPPRIAIKRVISAQGAAARYRVEDGMVKINALGQKRASLALRPDECRVMMRELTVFLEEVGV